VAVELVVDAGNPFEVLEAAVVRQTLGEARSVGQLVLVCLLVERGSQNVDRQPELLEVCA